MILSLILQQCPGMSSTSYLDNLSVRKDVNLRIGIAWIAIDRITTNRNLMCSEKSKTGILQSYSRVSTTIWMHHLDFKETFGEKT